MNIVCQQTVLIKYHAFLLFLKSSRILNFHLLQIVGGALRVNPIQIFACANGERFGDTVWMCSRIWAYADRHWAL